MVTIGFVAKEKFSLAAQALETLFLNTTIPFNLLVIDAHTPPRYRAAMDRVLRGRDNVRVVSVDHHLQPNQAKNLAVREARDDYVCLLENDSFVPYGWLETMLDACLTYPAGCVVFPELFEGPTKDLYLHADPALGTIRTWQEDGKTMREIVADPAIRHRYRDRSRRIVETTEAHIYLFHKSVMERIGYLDESITTREHIDLSLQLHAAGIPIVLEGSVQANFYQAPPVEPEERAFFRWVWNVREAQRSNDYLVAKWNLVNFLGTVGYARRQQLRTHHLSWWLVKKTKPWLKPWKHHFGDIVMSATRSADRRPDRDV